MSYCIAECVSYFTFCYMCDCCTCSWSDCYYVTCTQSCGCSSCSFCYLNFILFITISNCVFILSMCLTIICPFAICWYDFQFLSAGFDLQSTNCLRDCVVASYCCCFCSCSFFSLEDDCVTVSYFTDCSDCSCYCEVCLFTILVTCYRTCCC